MLEHYGVPRRYHDGDIIFRAGTRGAEMYVVRSGKIRIFNSDQGAEVTYAVLGPKEFFGEMSLLTGEPRSASAEAVGEVDLSVIDHATFSRLAGDPLVNDMLARMSQRLHDVDQEIQRLSGLDVLRREHLAKLGALQQWFA